MGISNSYIAVQGLDPARALEALQMEVVEVCEPDEMELSGIWMGELPGGWLLLLCDEYDGAFEGKLAQLATLGPAVACGLNEYVMYSEARGYEGGKQVWRIVHDPNEKKSRNALDIDGSPPPQFEAIARNARTEQDEEGGEEAGVDFIFDLPPTLVQSICGYALGEDEPEGFRYSRLRKIGSVDSSPRVKGNGFFARLFGRG
jgi:hypothetical protein